MPILGEQKQFTQRHTHTSSEDFKTRIYFNIRNLSLHKSTLMIYEDKIVNLPTK